MIEQILHMTKTADGVYRIGLSVPTDVPLDYAEIQMLDICGPHEMVEGTHVVETADGETWLKDRERIGFTIVRNDVQKIGPKTPQAQAITLGKNYDPQEIATLFGKSLDDVKHWQKNWFSGKGPRLHCRTPTGGGPAHLSSAWDLLMFIDHFPSALA